MKKIIVLVTATTLLISCGGKPKNELDKKKAELVKKKQELIELQKKITELEKYIALNDTSNKENKQKLVTTAELKPQDFQHFIEIQGTIDSEQNAFISPANPGLIT